MDVEVMFERTAAADEVAAVEAIFARSGIPVQVAYGSEARFGLPVSALDWFVVVVLGGPIVSFFSSLGSKAADDAYEPIKKWFLEMIGARGAQEDGYVQILDTDGTTLEVDGEIPDHALEALAEIDWENVRGNHLLWDAGTGRWVDAKERSG
jgi:hypothetical protein